MCDITKTCRLMSHDSDSVAAAVIVWFGGRAAHWGKRRLGVVCDIGGSVDALGWRTRKAECERHFKFCPGRFLDFRTGLMRLNTERVNLAKSAYETRRRTGSVGTCPRVTPDARTGPSIADACTTSPATASLRGPSSIGATAPPAPAFSVARVDREGFL